MHSHQYRRVAMSRRRTQKHTGADEKTHTIPNKKFCWLIVWLIFIIFGSKIGYPRVILASFWSSINNQLWLIIKLNHKNLLPSIQNVLKVKISFIVVVTHSFHSCCIRDAFPVTTQPKTFGWLSTAPKLWWWLLLLSFYIMLVYFHRYIHVIYDIT